ncbi:hypothetical protein EB118_09600 [bacterium]|nr:hypothetical protein [bacterium]
MILRELFYNNSDFGLVTDNMTYNPRRDSSVMKRSDTRKTRLTLKQINELRKASEKHILEQEKDLEFITQMYKPPPQPMA